MVIREKEGKKGLILYVESGYFRISTAEYEDNIKMKKFDIEFEQRLLELERKVLELRSKGLVEQNLELELTSY